MTHLNLPVEEFTTPNPVTVYSEESLDEVAFKMSKQKIGSVLVNDSQDQFLGIFTVTDALNALIEITRSQKENEL